MPVESTSNPNLNQPATGIVGLAAQQSAAYLEESVSDVMGKTELIHSQAARMEQLANRIFGDLPPSGEVTGIGDTPQRTGVMGALQDRLDDMNVALNRLDAALSRFDTLA